MEPLFSFRSARWTEFTEAIAWINGRAQTGDIALALETVAFPSTKVRGTRVFYLANNTKRCAQAEQLLQALAQQVPALVNQGAQPDTATASGSLAFTRQIKVPSLVLRLGFVTNLEDQAMLLQRSYELAWAFSMVWRVGVAVSPSRESVCPFRRFKSASTDRATTSRASWSKTMFMSRPL
jgi:hypothetical protein